MNFFAASLIFSFISCVPNAVHSERITIQFFP
jgi:hypothetical protein